MIRIAFYFLITLSLASCTIEEKTTFKSDFSGKTITQIDMNSVMMFMSMDSTGNAKSQFYKQIQKSLDSAAQAAGNGINLEMKFDTVSNVMSIGYSFKNLEDANQTIKKLTEKQQPSSEAKLYRWVKKGKVLVMPGLSDIGKMLDAQGGESNPMMKGMTFSMSRTFPKKIVKVSDSRFTLSDDKKTVSFKSTMDELTNNPLNEVTITFK